MLRIALASLIFWLGLSVQARCTEAAPYILVDQFGYLPSLEKRAVLRDPVQGFDAARSFSPGPRYAVVDTRTGRAVYEGKPVSWARGQVDPNSGDRVWWFDFTPVTKPGRYVVRDLEKRLDSDPFDISPDVYNDVLKIAFKNFYFQRAGFPKTQPFVLRGYEDAASHLRKGQDTEATLYSREGDRATARDLRGGWFDAGDYNQYTSWTANYVTALLAMYEENPSVWGDDFDIPESGNGVPDILDEAQWGLAWLARMQNRDGAMLSVLARDGSGSPPSKSTGSSRYGPPNTSATVTTAGAFAMAARVLNRPEYAQRAKRAWGWAEANPNVKFYNNDEARGTQGLAAGQQEVEADRLAKKRLIASVQMFGLTGESKFAKLTERLYAQVNPMHPDMTDGFEGNIGFALLRHAARANVNPRFVAKIKSDYTRAISQDNGWGAIERGLDPYGAPIKGYWWGSNGTKSRRGSTFTQAVLANTDQRPALKSLNTASHYLHYIHGVNPMGLVYISNMGGYGAERSVSELYHAWFPNGSKDFDSTKTSRYGPLPGYLVGGPNPSYERDACCPDSCGGYGAQMCKIPAMRPPEGQPPAKSYAEFNEGWPLNSWAVTENSLGYQIHYLRLLSKFAR